MTTNVVKFPEYAKLLEAVILNLRMRIRYGEDVSHHEVHDLMDAIHNIPQMLRETDCWHVPSNIDFDLRSLLALGRRFGESDSCDRSLPLKNSQ